MCVFERLRETGLKLNRDKYQIGLTEICRWNTIKLIDNLSFNGNVPENWKRFVHTIQY